MITSVVYVSNSGHTKEYAKILAEKIGLPVYELNTAAKELGKNSEIVFLGWLMAGTVKGYKKAKKLFKVKVLCAVGMSDSDSQAADVKGRNDIQNETELFYLQGGFDMNALHGIYKLMMKCMKSTVGAVLNKKENRSSEEDEMLDLLYNGGNKVSEENLNQVIEYINKYNN